MIETAVQHCVRVELDHLVLFVFEEALVDGLVLEASLVYDGAFLGGEGGREVEYSVVLRVIDGY